MSGARPVRMRERKGCGRLAAMEAIPHDRAAHELAAHLGPIFAESPDGVYVWLDEEHWVCNERFAQMFGYASPDELNDTPYLLQRLVHEDDQANVSWNYWNRVQALAFPVTFRFRGVAKDGSMPIGQRSDPPAQRERRISGSLSVAFGQSCAPDYFAFTASIVFCFAGSIHQTCVGADVCDGNFAGRPKISQ